MEIRYSTDAEAFYVTIGEGEIASTTHISDDVMVDVEADGTLHGIELLCAPAELTDEERSALVAGECGVHSCDLSAEMNAAGGRLRIR